MVEIIRYNMDNFAYLVRGSKEDACVVIDPGDAESVLAALSAGGLHAEILLATHGHADHTAGASTISRRTGCPPLVMPGKELAKDDSIAWSGGRLQVLWVPGHTRSHVAYYDSQAGNLFTGDTMFIAGCGRLSECDAATMWNSLMRLNELPDKTNIYPGHDYTSDNLAFAAHLLPEDTAVATRLAKARTGDPLVPSTLAQERRTNPFLRCADPAFRKSIGLAHLTPAACFGELRRRKDRW